MRRHKTRDWMIILEDARHVGDEIDQRDFRQRPMIGERQDRVSRGLLSVAYGVRRAVWLRLATLRSLNMMLLAGVRRVNACRSVGAASAIWRREGRRDLANGTTTSLLSLVCAQECVRRNEARSPVSALANEECGSRRIDTVTWVDK